MGIVGGLALAQFRSPYHPTQVGMAAASDSKSDFGAELEPALSLEEIERRIQTAGGEGNLLGPPLVMKLRIEELVPFGEASNQDGGLVFPTEFGNRFPFPDNLCPPFPMEPPSLQLSYIESMLWHANRVGFQCPSFPRNAVHPAVLKVLWKNGFRLVEYGASLAVVAAPTKIDVHALNFQQFRPYDNWPSIVNHYMQVFDHGNNKSTETTATV